MTYEFDNIYRIRYFERYLNIIEEFVKIEETAIEEYLSISRPDTFRRYKSLDGSLSKQFVTMPTQSGVLLAQRLDELENLPSLLRSWFFVSLLAHVEVELTERCEALENALNLSIPFSDYEAKRGFYIRVERYLNKVARINSVNRLNWTELQDYQKLRNCIVHCQGYIVDKYRHSKHLENYISKRKGLGLDFTQIIFEQEFCIQVIKKITEFFSELDSLLFTEVSKRGVPPKVVASSLQQLPQEKTKTYEDVKITNNGLMPGSRVKVVGLDPIHEGRTGTIDRIVKPISSSDVGLIAIVNLDANEYMGFQGYIVPIRDLAPLD